MLKGARVQAALGWLLGLYLRLSLRTTRWTLVGAEHVGPCFVDRPAVVAFWHERLPLMPQLWVMARRAGAPMGLHVLVSRHRDGRLIGRLMRGFGVGLVHGSSSRGGPAGLRACVARLRAGDHVVITPDGPRGPARVAADGVAQLAALAGVPVLPASAQVVRRITLHSWDRMVVPLPFGRGGDRVRPADRGAAGGVAGRAGAHRGRADRGGRDRGPAVRVTGAIAEGAWRAAGTLAEPALRVLLARRVRLGKEDPARLAERRGIDATPRPAGRLVWVHAASVGETISVLPVLHAIAARPGPAVALLLTTGTRTSAALAAERLPPGALHRYVPLDVPRWAGRFLDHWRPDAACFVESEIWPTLLGAARARGIPLMLLNARLSDRSFALWRRAAGAGAAGCSAALRPYARGRPAMRAGCRRWPAVRWRSRAT